MSNREHTDNRADDLIPAELHPLDRLLAHDARKIGEEPDGAFEGRVLEAALAELTPEPIVMSDHAAARSLWLRVAGWGGGAIAAGIAALIVLPSLFAGPGAGSGPGAGMGTGVASITSGTTITMISGATLEEDVAVLLALTETDATWEAELLSVLAESDVLLEGDGGLDALLGEGAI
ncbi:MAG: hypothetical protein AAF356_02025 [Planctomycetota bacterium]